ncbi:hypothetical protein [Paracoccus amoyensis]|nr:hypothetical protein [Paracoccus amoyensis]
MRPTQIDHGSAIPSKLPSPDAPRAVQTAELLAVMTPYAGFALVLLAI